ncbi:putative LRR receptor-like serine/threonine-protein kinase PAM74 [Cocos nucifera]|uniref:non-specific serine/threonine protein kinase n=1 Tax=Cocos nucifera TaxID=13894 RepID=A0A8K0IBP8_COCNU|nr:putative LRR receptor-like serine/threonine-protein kinase PAM74 [Cocos nucifera]
MGFGGLTFELAQDAAQGLEYLHKACKPPLIHKDVKTGNILLSQGLKSKIADFGLSKVFHSKACKAIALSWGERLRIAVDAAQGLEYLHEGCKPPLIHRDVKTGNILLSQGLEAKIADFGLSKVFHSDIQSHVSTTVVGTPGYLDPEYVLFLHFSYFGLQEKASLKNSSPNGIWSRKDAISPKVNVASRTNQTDFYMCSYYNTFQLIPESCGIIHWVHQRFASGNIEDAIDPRMKGEYDVSSIWKAADVALNYTEQASIQRPTMADVVMQLKEGLEQEAARERSMNCNLFTCSENLHTESMDESRNGIFETEHVGNISAVSEGTQSCLDHNTGTGLQVVGKDFVSTTVTVK